MRRLVLKPDQLIVPGDTDIHNEGILKIYYNVFENNSENSLPPVIAINKNTRIPSPRWAHVGFSPQQFDDSIKEYLGKNPVAEYFLLDGNHKSVAAALCNKPIPTLELTDDKDITECKSMLERGELFNWDIEGETLDDITYSLAEFLYGSGFGDRRDFFTVSDRLDWLIEDQGIPQYMVDRYQETDSTS